MNINNFYLEKEALDLCLESKKGKKLSEITPIEARNGFVKLQGATDCYHYPCIATDEMFELTKELGSINVRIISVPPQNQLTTKLPIIIYCHGGGWVMGDKNTHDKLIRELSHRTNSVIVFPEFTTSPEAKYPIALEQIYGVLIKCVKEADQRNWDINNLILAGDSAGGNLAIVTSMISKMRNGPKISRLLLYYPVTDCTFETESYKQFGNGDFYLSTDSMKWFWDQYTTNETDRLEVLASPLRASIDQLKGLPETMIINGEADVLYNDGDSFANKLRSVGVPVTHLPYQGMVHDFVALHCLDATKACRSAMDSSIDFINKSINPILKPTN